ncbi:hypothetical protein GCM10009839_23480 [Catenulispora yoronensis]|uniref:Uncharacterized protein n=1 Tax=Catenulispora yoronensis TaxID=450799 RepID=A0ABN2U095_9ACTN
MTLHFVDKPERKRFEVYAIHGTSLRSATTPAGEIGQIRNAIIGPSRSSQAGPIGELATAPNDLRTADRLISRLPAREPTSPANHDPNRTHPGKTGPRTSANTKNAPDQASQSRYRTLKRRPQPGVRRVPESPIMVMVGTSNTDINHAGTLPGPAGRCPCRRLASWP